MKHIRGMVMAALVVLIVGTWWNFCEDTRNNYQSYYDALKKGEAAEQEGLAEKAAEYYEQCLDLKDTLQIQERVYKNLRTLYKERKTYSDKKKLNRFLERVKSKYYHEPEPYEWAADFYYEQEEWKAVIQTAREAENQGVVSELLSRLWDEVRYKYEIGYASFEEIKELTEELYVAKDDAGWCYITRRGETYIAGPYDFATPMFNNTACVKSNGQAYMIDGEGKKQCILPNDVERVDFADTVWLPVIGSGDVSYYNTQTGERKGSYEYAGRFKDGIAAVLSNGVWNIIDENWDTCSPSGYEDVILSPTGSCYSDGYIIVKENGMYCFLNKGFEPAVDFTCEDLDFCRESVFAFSRQGKWGFADLDGEILIQPVYEEAKSYSNGLAAVMVEGKWGFIDEQGNLVIDCIFDGAGYFNNLGYCIVKKGEAWHFIHLLDWAEG